MNKEDGEGIKENDVFREACFASGGLHSSVAHFQEI
jgi:hypothetical protein